MIREILFRGKSLGTGEWVYGYFVNCASMYDDPEKDRVAEIIEVDADRIYTGEYDYYHTHEVNPETVGQWTGLVDKNGVKIFEGDVVQCSILYDTGCYPHVSIETRVVTYKDGYFDPIAFCEVNGYTVIGNIWDNPELMERK